MYDKKILVIFNHIKAFDCKPVNFVSVCSFVLMHPSVCLQKHVSTQERELQRTPAVSFVLIKGMLLSKQFFFTQ